MKILLLTHSFSEVTHGPAKFAQLLYEYGQSPASDLEVMILTEKPLEKPNVYPITVQPPRLFQAFIKLIRSWRYWRRARRMHANSPFDIVLFNDAITAFFAAIWPWPNVKVVGMLNDSAYIHPYYPAGQPLRKKIIKRFYQWVEKTAVRQSDWTICCSRFLAEETRKAYLTDIPKIKWFGVFSTAGTVYLLIRSGLGRPKPLRRQYKVGYLYQSVDRSQFKLLKSTYIIGPTIKVLFVKNDYQTGGLPYLLAALASLTTYHFELQLIGPLPAEKARVLSLEIGKNTQLDFVGPLPQAQVFERMATADLLCIPSLHEGLGVANIEALAIGLPVVSTRVGGITEVLGDGQFGWLANPGDATDLATQLAACINASPEERRHKAQLGRKQVEENFGHHQMLANLQQILLNLRETNPPH